MLRLLTINRNACSPCAGTSARDHRNTQFNAFHCMPVRSTIRMDSMHNRSGARRRWHPSGWVSFGTGSNGCIRAHSASGSRHPSSLFTRPMLLGYPWTRWAATPPTFARSAALTTLISRSNPTVPSGIGSKSAPTRAPVPAKREPRRKALRTRTLGRVVSRRHDPEHVVVRVGDDDAPVGQRSEPRRNRKVRQGRHAQ